MTMKVSVAIPVRDEECSIRILLDALCAQTRRPDEVVICDGGSTDATVKIIEEYARCKLPIALIRADASFPGRARNLAIQAARFDLIALTDAGIRLDPRWLDNIIAPFEAQYPPDVVYGNYEPVQRTFKQFCISLAFVPPRNTSCGLRAPSLASMALRRRVWMDVGGFREDLRSGEDILFMKHISEGLFTVRYRSDAIVFWNPPDNFSAAFTRFATYSYSGIRAGLAREWQIPLARIYLVTALLTATMLRTSLGLLVPLAMLSARAIKRLVREKGGGTVVRIPSIFGVMFALAVIDLATFWGCWRWLATEWIFSGRSADAANGGTR